MKKLIIVTIIISIFVGLGTAAAAAEEVNLYTNRHYDTDEEILNRFTEETGIEVNVLKGDSDQLIERIAREGKNSPADVLITADAGRLHRAKERDILQSVSTETLTQNVPANLRDEDNYWYGLTIRGRVIVYSKDRVDPEDLAGYGDLTSDQWQDKIVVRSSENIYNQSLLASLVSIYGEKWAEDWAAGIVDNMARKPQGNDLSLIHI